MTRAPRRSHFRRFCLLCSLLALGLTAPGTTIYADSPARATPGRSQKTGLIVFVSYRGNFPPPLHPTELRLSGSRLISAALEERGQDIVTYPELESIMRQWRIRSDRDLSYEFLHALDSQFSVTQLVVAELVVHPDRLLILARGLLPGSGWLIWADVIEELSTLDVWADPSKARANWERIVGDAARKLAGRRGQEGVKPVAKTLVALPLKPVGVERGSADVMTHCLLSSLLDSGDWRLPDPALVVSVLQREGLNPLLLEDAAREALASQWDPYALLVPGLVSFHLTQRRSVRGVEDRDEPRSAFYNPDTDQPFYLTIVAVDCASGQVVAGGSEYLEPEDRLGLFGISKNLRVARRFQKGTDRLVRHLTSKGGDS